LVKTEAKICSFCGPSVGASFDALTKFCCKTFQTFCFPKCDGRQRPSFLFRRKERQTEKDIKKRQTKKDQKKRQTEKDKKTYRTKKVVRKDRRRKKDENKTTEKVKKKRHTEKDIKKKTEIQTEEDKKKKTYKHTEKDKKKNTDKHSEKDKQKKIDKQTEKEQKTHRGRKINGQSLHVDTLFRPNINIKLFDHHQFKRVTDRETKNKENTRTEEREERKEGN